MAEANLGLPASWRAGPKGAGVIPGGRPALNSANAQSSVPLHG